MESEYLPLSVETALYLVMAADDTCYRLSEGKRLRNADNYTKWAKRMFNMLESKGLELTIDPFYVKPDLEPQESDPTEINSFTGCN